MENRDFVRELNSPPLYHARGYEPLKEEVEFHNNPGQQTTVVTLMPEDPPIRDHLIWSIFNTMYMNMFCLGLLALVFSVKARDRKLVRDPKGAASYGSTARSLNIAATTLSILAVVIVIILAIVLTIQSIEFSENTINHQFGK